MDPARVRMVPAVEAARELPLRNCMPADRLDSGVSTKRCSWFVMTAHAEQAPPVGFDGPTKPGQPFRPVFVVSDRRAAFVAPRDLVVQGTRKLDP